MKKCLLIFMSIFFCMFFTQAALAELEGNAAAHVYVVVDPNVAIGVVDTNVNLGSVQMGEFGASITFRVDANMQDVWLWAAVTQLYKGDNPAEGPGHALPLPIVEAEGVLIDPTDANPMAGDSPVADYEGVLADVYNGFFGLTTRRVHFESSTPGHFSQDVDLSMKWNQPDPEQPQGEYSGHVILYCLLTPPV